MSRIGPFSSFKPEYCAAIIDHCEAGGSVSSFGGVVGVTRQTVYNWRKEQPEFDEACEIGVLKAAFLDEEALAKLARGDAEKGNLGALVYRLGNRLKEEWRNVTRTEVSGPDGAAIPLSIEVNFVKPAPDA